MLGGYDFASIGSLTQEDPIGLAGGLNLYGFASGDPVNFRDPFGLTKCKVDDFWCNFRRTGWQMFGTLLGFFGGSGTGAEVGLACGPAAEVCVPAGAVIGGATGAFAGYTAFTMAFDKAEGGAGSGDGFTDHGRERIQDPSRLNATEVDETVQNATARYVQPNGRTVFVQQVGDRFNVVVKEGDAIHTTFKTLRESALNRLKSNFGWEPIP